MRSQSSSVRGSRRQIKTPDDDIPEPEKFQPFVKEEVLVGIVNVRARLSYKLRIDSKELRLF